MLVNLDVKGLEVCGAAFLSKDPVLYRELLDDEDIHENNRARFNLPSRLIAKTFKFRLIYGGSAYSYAHDPEFMDVSSSEKFWQEVIDEYYKKYAGLGKWHTELVRTVIRTGQIEIPTGRIFTFEPLTNKRTGDLEWPRTQILNYPVQGFGADVVMLIRLSLWNRLKHLKERIKFVNTVHDSILLDVENDPELWYNIYTTIKKVFEDFPVNFEKLFKVKFDLPLRVEVEKGEDWYNMEGVDLNAIKH